MERRERFATGGGPSVSVETDRVDERVREALGVAVEGGMNIYDSDGIAQTRMERATEQDPHQINEDQYEDTLLNGSWTSFSASQLNHLFVKC